MPIQGAFSLNPNEIFASLANMIISQEVFADNLGKHAELVDKARVDGGLYGDKKLYYATDVLKSHPWGMDAEAGNLLNILRPDDPQVQAIELDVFRQIDLTVDYYMSKRAWMGEGAFQNFTGVMLGWMKETKRVYDGTLYNVFIGTTETSQGEQDQVFSVDKNVDASAEYEAKEIARQLADLLVAMGDYNRDFNDYGFLRSYANDAIKVIWNSKFVNRIKKVDLPAIFHKEGLVDKFDAEVLASRYFGRDVAAADIGSGKVIGLDGVYDNTKGTIRSRVEKEIVSNSSATAGGNAYHVFPGDELPNGAVIADAEGSGVQFLTDEVYIEDSDAIIAKVLVKLPPFMSAFEVGTSFFNPKSLTENHYLTFGHNTLKYLKNYPFITIREEVIPVTEGD